MSTTLATTPPLAIAPLTVTAYTITGAPRLDPIRVLIEDLGPNSGRLMIGCYGESWENYWGGCGKEGIRAFLQNADAEYLANRLLPGGAPAQKRGYLIRIVQAVKDSLALLPADGRMFSRQCPGGCTHTGPEHNAFDHGLLSGEIDPKIPNPFNWVTHQPLSEAWEAGRSVGLMNRDPESSAVAHESIQVETPQS